MGKTEVRGGQIKDESITSADIGPDAVGNSELDNSGDFTMNSLILSTTLSVTTTSTLTGAVGIGGSPVTDAALAITSTTKALLLPRMTTIQMDAILTPLNGMLIFDTTLNQFMGYNGTAWVILG